MLKTTHCILQFPVIVLLFISGCKKEELGALAINKTELTLHYDDRFQFIVTLGGEAVPAASIQWSSTDEYTGSVDVDGILWAGIIGNTTITGEYNGRTVTCEVTVKPRLDILVEPLITLGASKADVQRFEKRTLVGSFDYDQVEYYSTTADEIIWSVIYFFQNEKLSAVRASIRNDLALREQTLGFYKERYISIGTGYAGTIDFTDRDNTLDISLFLNPGGLNGQQVAVSYSKYLPR